VEYEELVGKMAIKVRIGKMKEQMEAQQKMNAILETVKG
jgi:hypothetical protein